MNSTPPYDLIIGLDRADKKADLCLIETATGQRRTAVVDAAPEALCEWLADLRQQHPQARVGLCLEQPAVHLIPFLETYAWITLHPINPITLQKYREAFVTSRAKDDTKDAEYLADLLRHHHAQLPVWAPQDSATRAVQQLVTHRRAVVDERTALSNRLIALLKQYFPQALTLCGDNLWRPLATAFLLKWPSLGAVQKAKPATVKAFYYLHGSRSAKLLEQRLALIAQAVPVTDETAVIESFVLRVQLLARELQQVVRTIAAFDEQIATAYAAHPDHGIFASLPGAGTGAGPAAAGQLGGGSGALRRERGATAMLHGRGPRDQTQWRERAHSPALLLSEVSSPELPRVRQGKHSVESVGGGVLSATTHQRLCASHGGAGAGLQVATGDLALLAGSQAL